MNVGDIIKADVFAEGDSVDVRGTSAKVRATPAPLSAGTSEDLRKLTVQALFTVTAVPWAPAQLRQEFSRERKWQDTSAMSA